MKNFVNYEEAKKIVQSLGLKSRLEWIEFTKIEEFKNLNLPVGPSQTYKNDNFSWGDFLGAGTISSKKREFLSYEEAKKQLCNLNLKSVSDWRRYIKLKNFHNMPKRPEQVYKNNGWVSWSDFLGASE